jgi:hypothetical protein
MVRWSECAVDDTDDQLMGDYRDGDETWYKYRTQQFCANSAFSLYGIPKGTTAKFWQDKSKFGCSEPYFINSFFTYGGADTLLKSVGIQPDVYYMATVVGNQGGRKLDEAASYNGYYNPNVTNAVCLGVDYGNDGNGNRMLGGSHDNNNQFTSTMGCSVEGDYNIAVFASSMCDGNYYEATIDTFSSYNQQHDNLRCRRIWHSSDNIEVGEAEISYLMANSWSCDLHLYPQGCPDPYGKKAKLDYALETASRGGNAFRAYKVLERRRPLRIASIAMAVVAFLTLVMGYYLKNHKRIHDIEKSAPVKGRFFKYRGISYLWCICLDIAYITKMWWTKFCIFMVAIGMSIRTTFFKIFRPKKKSDTEKNESSVKDGGADEYPSGFGEGSTSYLSDELDDSIDKSAEAGDSRRRLV